MLSQPSTLKIGAGARLALGALLCFFGYVRLHDLQTGAIQ